MWRSCRRTRNISCVRRLASATHAFLRTEGGNGFGLTAHVDVCIKAYQQRTVNYLADIYSTRCDTSVERQEVTIPLAAPARTVSQDAQLRLEFDGSQPFISVTGGGLLPGGGGR